MKDKFISGVAFVVSLNFNGSGADELCYGRKMAQAMVNSYLNECRLRHIEGEITFRKIRIPNFSKYTLQDYFDGMIEDVEEILIERLKISFK